MKLLTVTLALLMAMPTLAQRSKSKTEAVIPAVTTGGISYSLPRTGIRIKVKATKTTFAAGPYAAYAESLLGISDIKMQSGVSWNIEDIDFTTFSEPDPEHRYLTGNVNAALVQLTSDGCLAGINSTAVTGTPAKPVSNAYTSKPRSPELLFTNLTGSTDLTGRSPLETRAATAAATILKARTARLDIVTGMFDEFHPDGKAYEESFEELHRIEKDNLELFIGKSASEEHTFYFDFVPPSRNVKGEVVFRFDETLGFLPKADFSGKPVMIDVEKSGPATASPDRRNLRNLREIQVLRHLREIQVLRNLREIQVLRHLRNLREIPPLAPSFTASLPWPR